MCSQLEGSAALVEKHRTRNGKERIAAHEDFRESIAVDVADCGRGGRRGSQGKRRCKIPVAASQSHRNEIEPVRHDDVGDAIAVDISHGKPESLRSNHILWSELTAAISE